MTNQEIKKAIKDELSGIVKKVSVQFSGNSRTKNTNNIFVNVKVSDNPGVSFWYIVDIVRNAGFNPVNYSQYEAKHGDPKTALVSVRA
jgi:hypothetical protein